MFGAQGIIPLSYITSTGVSSEKIPNHCAVYLKLMLYGKPIILWFF